MGEATTLAVHRCRFIDYTPSPISALAFPPLPLPKTQGKKLDTSPQSLKFGTLAIGRANGNVELCEWTGEGRQVQASQAWVVRKTLSGPFPSKVDSLAFTLRSPDTFSENKVPSCSDLRLFSSGGGSELVEWDIQRGCVRRTLNSQGGSIWSMAVNPASTLLALGCEDGSVRLLDISYDALTHQRRFDRVKCRLLSIAWGPPIPKQANTAQNEDGSDDDDEDEWSDSWIVTGGSDSSLRKWDCKTGRVIDRMGTDKMRGERTLVWTVGVLGDGTIVSGDSLGMVKFWDSRTCTQLQSFQGHGADVLCLAISPEGDTVYTSGVDQKITQFSHIKSPKSANGSSILHNSSRWVQSSSRRMHSHDVRTLCIWPPNTPLPLSHKRKLPINIAPILASGGLDMSVVLTPAAPTAYTTITKIINPLSTSVISTFEDSYHRRLSYSSGPSSTSAIQVAKQARLVCCMRDTSVSVWRILPRVESSTMDGDQMASVDPSTESGGWEKVLDMEFSVHTNITACAISDNGKWLVVSDLYEARLLTLQDEDGSLKPRRVRNFSSILQQALPEKSVSLGGSAFSFTPDSQRLVMATAISSHIIVFELDTEGRTPRFLRLFNHHRAQNLISGNRVVKKSGTKRKVSEAQEAQDDDAMDEDTSVVINDQVGGHVYTSVTRMAISADGQWLASTDGLTRTYIFNLDSLKHHCVLPSFHQPAQSLTFEPLSPNLLILTFANNSFQIFDVETCLFPEWSKKLINSLPKRFTHIHDPLIGMTFDPTPPAKGTNAHQRALFWGSTWICKVNIDGAPGRGGFSKKRRRESMKPTLTNGDVADQRIEVSLDEEDSNFKMVTHYRPILFVDFLGPAELLVVERPLVDVLATLPPAYFKPKYGAT